MTTKVTSNVLGTNSAGSTQVADNSIDTAALQNLSVTSAKLDTAAVTEAKIASSAVSEAKIANGAVTEDKLGALSVTSGKLANDAVATAKIANLAVTNGKLADSSVTLAKMATNAIGTDQIVNLAVTNAKINDGTINEDKLSFTPLTVGLSTVWLPARAIYPSSSNGANAVLLNFASVTKPSIPVLSFSTVVKQYVEFSVYMPKSYDQGDINLYAVWTHPSTTTNFGVRWEFSKLHVGDGATLDTTFGSSVSVTDTGGSTSYLYVSNVATLTGGSPAVGKLAFFKLARDVAHADDNMAVSAYLLGVIMTYNTNKKNDN